MAGGDGGADGGENSIGIRLAWRSFQAPISRSASSSTWASVARRGFLLGALPALILHLTAVEAHSAPTLPSRALLPRLSLCKPLAVGIIFIEAVTEGGGKFFRVR
jgi:hypothetical protein